MDATLEERHNPDQDLDSQTELIQHLDTHLKLTQDEDVNQEDCEDDDEYEYEEEEFSFFCGDTSTSPVAAEDAFVDGHIKQVFPLFNRDLVFSGEDPSSMHENLPMKPPVKKVFVETNGENSHAVTSSTPEDDEIAGPYCEWSSRKAVEVSPEIAKKSNSTGFSKIWRFKEFVRRSHSDGRDAFVFLNNNHGHAAPSTAEKPAPAAAEEEKGESTVKIVRKVKKSGKSKTAPLSAHEVYLRSKGKQDERRRSYLPYRPELMGFFTTVSSGGLTKNVHPY